MTELDLIKLLNENNVSVGELMSLVCPGLSETLETLMINNKTLETLEIVMRSKQNEELDDYWYDIKDSVDIILK